MGWGGRMEMKKLMIKLLKSRELDMDRFPDCKYKAFMVI